jgi:alpha-tubulin suppressor-like RCC1 family protein
VVAVAAENNHSLALKSDGTVVSWGAGLSGPITPPAGLSGVLAIAAGGDYSLAIVAAPPSLSVEASGENIFLSWPIWAGAFSLESTTNLDDANSWTAVADSPVVVDSQNRITVPISGPHKFYRLKK